MQLIPSCPVEANRLTLCDSQYVEDDHAQGCNTDRTPYKTLDGYHREDSEVEEGDAYLCQEDIGGVEGLANVEVLKLLEILLNRDGRHTQR